MIRNIAKRCFRSLPWSIQPKFTLLFPGHHPYNEVNLRNNLGQYYSLLERAEERTLHSLREEQTEKLVRIYRHAFATVPFYRSFYKKHGLTIDSVKGLDDASKIPVLKKEQLKRVLLENPESMISAKAKRKMLRVHRTGGSTGIPLRILGDESYQKSRMAKQYRWKVRAGIRDRDLMSYLIVPRTLLDEDLCENPLKWQYCPKINLLSFDMTQTDQKSMRLLVDLMKEFRPVSVQGYCSAVYLLASFMKEHNEHFSFMKCTFTSSEKLYPEYREVMEKVFGAPVFDRYGQGEEVATGFECDEHNGFHLDMECGYVEVLSEDDEPVTETMGRIVGTNFESLGMPLIRYEVGDLGVLTERKCACGLAHQLLESVSGRDDEFLQTPGGRRFQAAIIHEYIIHTNNLIMASQFVQKSLDRITVSIVPTRPWKKEEVNAFEAELRANISSNIKYDIEFIDEIPRGDNYKYKLICSEIN